MDEAVEPLTQPYADPRRDGLNNSGLAEQDVSDIICILHPSSPDAHTAVALTASNNPQHVLQQYLVDEDTGELVHNESFSDIALRLSSLVKNPVLGFSFGRNHDRCDIILSNNLKISSTHFRIYLTLHGILMLQDTSTNGTIVDNKLIIRDGRYNSPITQMLVSGSIIQVTGGKGSTSLKFVVRIPSRDEFQSQYSRNVAMYLQRIRGVNKRIGDGRADRVNFIAPGETGSAQGMHWNGGPHYNVTGKIGKGAFATVYKLGAKNDGAVYACKELDKQRFMKNNVLDHKVDSEMKIMKGLDHPNIVRFHDYFDYNNRYIYIVMEFVSGGELTSLVQQHDHLPEHMVKTVSRQILHALHYLHAKKITHRDIKPDNILISSFEPLRVKLSDFGLSKVVQDETFLKTFCGTLLYCAPEVYPEYDNYKYITARRKRRRTGEPLPRTSPYDQAVDIWSFGAVLFHILCGSPPYMGRGDDRGAQMLRNIMTTEADYDMLRAMDVSQEGVDFISKLLNRDPKARPKEQECLQHPWLRDEPDAYDYMDIDIADDDGILQSELPVLAEVNEDFDLDASNLDINDFLEQENYPSGNLEEEQETSSSDRGQLKKPRVTEEPITGSEQILARSSDIKYPSLPAISSYGFVPDSNPDATPTGPRLFGEIPKSALQSSGVLGHYHNQFVVPECRHAYGGTSISNYPSSTDYSEDGNGFSLYSAELLRSSKPGEPNTSLMGAESLVGQLHMESMGQVAPPSAQHDRDESQEAEAQDEEEEQQQLSFVKDPFREEPYNHADYEALVSQRDPESSPSHYPLTSSKTIAKESDSNKENNTPPDPISPHNSKHDNDSDDELPEELICTVDEYTGEPVRHSSPIETKSSSPIAARTHPQSQGSSGKPLAQNNRKANEFVRPAIILGKLTPLPGSIVDRPIRLESRMTSWGRGMQTTIRHPEPMDFRIPSYALEITFWAPSIEARIAAGEDWLQMSDLVTTISTKTSRYIWVNDIQLRKENETKDAFLFGKIYTGDIITIYRSRDQFLRFRCEFYHGNSKKTRPDEENKFTIQQSPKTLSNIGIESDIPLRPAMLSGNTLAGSTTTSLGQQDRAAKN